MPKVTLSDISNLSGNPGSAQTTINSNSLATETAIENTLSRDGTAPNEMGASLDMNGNDLLNVGDITYSNGDSVLTTGTVLSVIGGYLYPRTAAEIAAGVTPSSYRYEPGDLRRYGAVLDGITDDSAAVVAALAANTNVIHPGGSCKLASAAAAALSDAVIEGRGDAEFLTNGTNGFNVTGDNVRFTRLEFRSAQTASVSSDIFIYAANCGGLTVDNCEIGRGRIQHRSTASTPEAKCTIRDCDFTGDYTGSSGADVNNVIDLRGVTDIHITGNRFACVDWYRILKVSSATGDTSPYDTGRSKRALFTDNIVNSSASAAQQAFDFYASTEELVVSNNVFALTGTIPAVVHIKPDGSSEAAPYPNNAIIANNVFKLGSGVVLPIFCAGAWGTAAYAVKCKVRIAGNVIEEAGTTTSAAITVKGFNVAIVEGNTREAPAVAYSTFISASNNQLATITGNHSTFGTIVIAGNGSTPAGASYSNQGESVIVHGNVVDDFNAQGAVILSTITAFEEITIADNHLRNQTDTGNVAGAVYFTTVTCTHLNIHDNTSNLANASKNQISGAPTVTTWREHDNSWNFATATWDPGSLSDGVGETSAAVTLTGAAFGDVVSVAAPYDLQGITCNAYVSAANTVKARLQNESGGSVDLASGTWRFTVRKG